VTDNIYTSPGSDVEQVEPQAFSPVKKPWPRWLIAAWIFITFSIVVNGLGRVIAGYFDGSEALAKQISAVFFLAEFVLIYGVIKLNKVIVYTVAVICILLGLFQLARIVMMLFGIPNLVVIVLSLSLYVVPTFLCAWYLLRPSFRMLIERNDKYNKMESMRKYVAKSFSKRA